MESSNDVLTVEAAAELLGFTARTVREMLKAGEIPGVKLRGSWRISRRQLIEAIEAKAD